MCLFCIYNYQTIPNAILVSIIEIGTKNNLFLQQKERQIVVKHVLALVGKLVMDKGTSIIIIEQY